MSACIYFSMNKKNGEARNMNTRMDYYMASSNDSNQNDDVFLLH